MNERPSHLQTLIYYSSFVLVYATLAFIASRLLMDYEDSSGRTSWSWEGMRTSDKIGYITFAILQFPFGLLFELLTNNYNNGLFAFLINPLFIAWLLHQIFRKNQLWHIKRSIKINGTIWALIIVFV